MRPKVPKLENKMYQMLLVELIEEKLVEVLKICQPLQIWLSPKNQNRLSPKSQIYQM